MFPLSISLKTKAFTSYFKVPSTVKYTQVPGTRDKVGQNRDARKPSAASLLVFK